MRWLRMRVAHQEQIAIWLGFNPAWPLKMEVGLESQFSPMTSASINQIHVQKHQWKLLDRYQQVSWLLVVEHTDTSTSRKWCILILLEEDSGNCVWNHLSLCPMSLFSWQVLTCVFYDKLFKCYLPEFHEHFWICGQLVKSTVAWEPQTCNGHTKWGQPCGTCALNLWSLMLTLNG